MAAGGGVGGGSTVCTGGKGTGAIPGHHADLPFDRTSTGFLPFVCGAEVQTWLLQIGAERIV